MAFHTPKRCGILDAKPAPLQAGNRENGLAIELELVMFWDC